MSHEAAYFPEEFPLMDLPILLARYKKYIIAFSFATMMLMLLLALLRRDDMPFNCNHECPADVA
jgi:hypothetical protein